MNRFRKLMALVAVMSLLLALWVPAAVFAAPTAQQEELLYFGRSIIAQMDNSEALYFVYDRLVEGLTNYRREIDITHDTYRVTEDEAWTAYDLVRSDHPEFFYVESYSLSYYQNTAYHFNITYSQELLSYANLVNHRAKVLTAGLEGKSDYEKSLILHDRICDAVKYNLNSAHNQTVVSSLALGESVCAGYSRAYQMMLQMLGIPCFYVTGTAQTNTGIGAHGWNLVQLDGEWYYTDVTWDDQNDNGGAIYYAYLNTTYDQISRDHFAGEYADYLPRTKATANNYFVKNGLVLTPGQSINVKKAAAAIRNSSYMRFYFTGTDKNEAVNMVIGVLDDILIELVGKYNYYTTGMGLMGNELLVFWGSNLEHTFETSTIPACGHSPGTVTNHCTKCGYTTKQTLSPVGHETEWEWDDTHHTSRCHHCGVADFTGEHRFVGNSCADCGYVIEVCEHVYDNICDADCNECGAMREVGEHVYDNLCDADCNECGAMREVGEHVYDNACDTDCNECGAMREVGEHVYDNDKDADCNECGAVRVVVILGDVDGNGRINNRDLAKIQQYITGWIGEIDLAAADVDGNGRINNRDLAKIQQYITGWIDELG